MPKVYSGLSLTLLLLHVMTQLTFLSLIGQHTNSILKVLVGLVYPRRESKQHSIL
jgi:ABC-type spermidine/putrescine transport system permease subunit II